eukprot:2536097-Ditylum_brightwellii.AAC.1
MAAWQHSGMKITQVSAWVMAIHLVILDDQNREFGLVLISAHAPIGTAEEEEWYTFSTNLDIATQISKKDNTILIKMDGNTSMRINNGSVCGPYGINNTNNAGYRLHTYLATKGLVSVSTFF